MFCIVFLCSILISLRVKTGIKCIYKLNKNKTQHNLIKSKFSRMVTFLSIINFLPSTFLSLSLVGWASGGNPCHGMIGNIVLFKDIHIIISGTYKYITLHSKRKLRLSVELRLLISFPHNSEIVLFYMGGFNHRVVRNRKGRQKKSDRCNMKMYVILYFWLCRWRVKSQRIWVASGGHEIVPRKKMIWSPERKNSLPISWL